MDMTMKTSIQEVLANNDVNVFALLGAREAQNKTLQSTANHYSREFLEKRLNTYCGTVFLK